MTVIKANLQLNNYEDFLHCTFYRSEGPIGNTICLVLINILHMQQEVEKKPQNFLHTYLRRTFIPTRIYNSWPKSHSTHILIRIHTYIYTYIYNLYIFHGF